MAPTRRGVLAGATLLAASSAVRAEENLRIVVPFGAGSGTDNTMRVFAEAYRIANGRTVIIDDKPGGGTTIGTLEVSRSKQMPDVPTFGEYGIQADIPGWSGFWGPPKLPPDVVDTLYKNLLKTAHERSFETFTTDNGGEIVGLPPAEFAAYVASEIERYRKVLPPLGIQID